MTIPISAAMIHRPYAARVKPPVTEYRSNDWMNLWTHCCWRHRCIAHNIYAMELAVPRVSASCGSIKDACCIGRLKGDVMCAFAHFLCHVHSIQRADEVA